MRKLPTILAILGLAVGISALSARADGVTYTVTSTYASDTSTTAVSAPGASFTFTFTVPSPCSSSPLTCSVSAGFVNLTSMVTFSSSTLTGFSDLGTFSFAPLGGLSPGLFSLTFPDNTFDWEFMGPQMFNSTLGEFCAGPAGTFCTGPFTITGGTGFPLSPSGSFFFDLSDPTLTTGGDLTGGSVAGTSAVTPEPSSLLLLGGGFLALGGFARRRLSARFN